MGESDDTLSDGGDFYDTADAINHQKPASLPDTIPIPIVPATPVRDTMSKTSLAYEKTTPPPHVHEIGDVDKTRMDLTFEIPQAKDQTMSLVNN